MSGCVTNFLNKRKLRKWARRDDGDPEGKYRVKRRFDEDELYYDLYWTILRKSDNHHVDSLYRRSSKTAVIDVMKAAEEKDLPSIIENLLMGAEVRRKNGGNKG